MSLFESLGSKTPPTSNFQTVLSRFQQLLNSGKISQSQLNQAVQIAQQLQKLLK